MKTKLIKKRFLFCASIGTICFHPGNYIGSLPANWQTNPVAAGFHIQSKNPYTLLYASDYEDQTQILSSFSLGKELSFRSVLYEEPQIVWDVNYNIDALGRRKTVQSQKQKKYFLSLLGCSFTFGTGLQDSETIASQLAKQSDDFSVTNYGIRGAGPNQILRLVEVKNEFQNELPAKKGLFLYIYYPNQALRPWGYRATSEWVGPFAWYKKVKSEYRYQGSIEENHPLFLYTNQFLWHHFPQAFAWIENWKFYYPYSCDLVAEIRNRLKRALPDSQFLVVEHPLERDPIFESCMKQRGVDLLPWQDFPVTEADVAHDNGHPTAQFNRRWAPVLMKQIADWQKKSKK